MRSFEIKDLAGVFARSLRNKDLLVKYFSVNNLRVQDRGAVAVCGTEIRDTCQRTKHWTKALKPDFQWTLDGANVEAAENFQVDENATPRAKALPI